MFYLKITLSGLHLIEGVVSVLRLGKGRCFDFVEVVDLVEFIIEDVVELRVLQDVSPLITQPSFPFSGLPQGPVPLLFCSLLIFIIFMYNCHRSRRLFLAPARQAAICSFFEVGELTHLLLETTVVLLQFSELAAEGVLLFGCALVDPLDEEVVVQSESRLRDREALNNQETTWGTSNKPLYLLKKSIDYSPTPLHPEE